MRKTKPGEKHLHNRTHCDRGHPLTPDNLQFARCAICNEIDMQAKKEMLLKRVRKRKRTGKSKEQRIAEYAALKAVNPRLCDHPDLHPATKENTTKKSSTGGGLCALCQTERRLAKKPMPRRQFCRRGHERMPENTTPFGFCRICKRVSDARYEKKRPKPVKPERVDEDFLYWRDQVREWGENGFRPFLRLTGDEEMRRIFANAPPLPGRKCARSGQLEEGDTG